MRTTVIAEIGINHNGDVETAKRLIDSAVEAGCDYVKFQKRTVDVVFTPAELARERSSIFGTTNGDLKRGLEFGQREYIIIDRHCKKRGIPWFASCWDVPSVDFMEEFDPPCYKVASACLTDIPLLSYICTATGRPVLLSTGMSTMDEIRKAVYMIGTMYVTLLHCVSTYPSEPEELNLAAMETLRQAFQVPVGYSGHEKGIALSLAAVAMGATVIERHITLDRTMWGTDQAASLEPHGIKKLVRDIRLLEKATGDGVKRVMPREIPIREKLRNAQ